ncbi:MAG: hypothetical protein IJ339_07105, partial [Oscillospiraceae bacterium]|nr:hypothetical protein [Oscillospiraceae bacterium]
MKKYLSALLCIIMIFSMPFTAYADVGPKPSVNITFKGVDNGTVYYGTLLSERESTGPASAWDGIEGHERHYDYSKELWRVFADYQDTDGYYFLQEVWKCTETNQLNWTYYPPSTFKILLYFPDTDTYYVSDIYERYAFDSYYTVDLSDLRPEKQLTAEKSYDFTWEIISIVARIAATIVLEIAIAFVFGYREKKTVRFIAAVNIITQVLLNVTLNIINYSMGGMAFFIFFILLEIAVFVLEAVIYAVLLRRFATNKTKGIKTTAYAFVANLFSFAAGMWLSF